MKVTKTVLRVIKHIPENRKSHLHSRSKGIP